MMMRYWFIFVCLFGTLLGDPLPSWNEGPVKNRILAFIEETSRVGGSNYVPIKNRIAVFDEDGTLWIEQPLYVQFFFAVDKVKELAPQHPEWKDTEPFKSIIEDKLQAIQGFSEKDIAQILIATHTGMSTDQFQQAVRNWLDVAVHPRFNRLFTELVYQPMLEVIHLLKMHQFRVYIVSGGGQEFMRAYSEQLYKIPVEHVIGTAGKMKYQNQDGDVDLIKLPELLFVNNFAGKVEGINLIIGKKPTIAFGNSTGDQQMLEWTGSNSGKTLQLLVHHDDPKREYAYGPDSKIGTFSDALMEEANKSDWVVISMKNDWETIFPPEKPKEKVE